LAANASADAVFRVRAIAALIVWLETCPLATAVEVLCNIGMLLCSDFPERSMPIIISL
jgi:hypothetical protein